MATVSVVMATYNGARFIEDQLRSLARQCLPPDELIVSDDDSDDATVDIVERFRATAPFPVIVRRNERRLGYGENFLSAARMATGDLIAFCDQDDVWYPEKLQVAAERLVQTDATLFCHAATVIDRTGRRTGRFSQGIRRSVVVEPLRMPPWGVLYGCSMVFPRALLELVDAAERGGHTFEYEGLISHDLWVYFLATSLGEVVLDARPLIDYRQHGGNVTPQVFGGGLRAWSASLGVKADPRLRRGDIARHRSTLMKHLSVSAEDERVRRTAATATDYWRTIGDLEDARIDLYSAVGPVRRAGRWLGLVRRGGYRACARGGLGGRLLAKDLLYGVVRADTVARTAGGRRLTV